jgi:hypothetical protein
MEVDFMDNSNKKIKDILLSRNIVNKHDELEEIAEEIAESIEGLKGKEEIANTIHANLVASGVSFKDVDNLMGVAEDIASQI